MLDEFMTTSEVADYLKVSKATVWRWCIAGRLPAFRIGQHWRIKRHELERMIDALTVTPNCKGDSGNDMTNCGS